MGDVVPGQPTGIEPALLEPHGTREVGVVAAILLDEALGFSRRISTASPSGPSADLAHLRAARTKWAVKDSNLRPWD
jgi:hypothetical protein